jgi:hypothetical protein
MVIFGLAVVSRYSRQSAGRLGCLAGGSAQQHIGVKRKQLMVAVQFKSIAKSGNDAGGEFLMRAGITAER